MPSLDSIDGTQAAEDGSISIREVVARVKCELYGATKDIRKDYWWFRYWGAKVDLDLIVNEQAGLTPSVAFVTPFHPFASKLIGTISQSFSLGVTGGLTSNAIRTETVSFSATFLEVRDQLDSRVENNKRAMFNDCVLPEGSELNGNLGLKQWIESALGPVKGGDAALLNWGGAVAAAGAPKQAKMLEALPPQSIASKACHWTPGTPPLKNAACRPPIELDYAYARIHDRKKRRHRPDLDAGSLQGAVGKQFDGERFPDRHAQADDNARPVAGEPERREH